MKSKYSNSEFSKRHIGSNQDQVKAMLKEIGYDSMDEFIEETIPNQIRFKGNLNVGDSVDEYELIHSLKMIASKNKPFKSYIGTGYYNTITPNVILRNIFENPGWYTAYTPYQAEISQGRLEALLNFQTMVMDMTGMEIANASLLDEATAAGEAMVMMSRENPNRNIFYADQNCHPQTIELLRTRSEPVGINLVVCKIEDFDFNDDVIGALIQYPSSDGKIFSFDDICQNAHSKKSLIAVATDLLALALIPSPGEIGADIAIGSSQRFGVPVGFGGPHAAFISAKERFKRKMPGRMIGVSVDSKGNRALRMALQTREQHIRRAKATSNICTAQVLLSVMASMYAVYHGRDGIISIANNIHEKTSLLASSLAKSGFKIVHSQFFDTIRIELEKSQSELIKKEALKNYINLRYFDNHDIGISLDETVNDNDLIDILSTFNAKITDSVNYSIEVKRISDFMRHPVFNSYQSETEMMRYIHKLETKDLALNTSMISLGSCTMKLNAATQMIPVSWNEFSNPHPFAPLDQNEGYLKLFDDLSNWLKNITGLEGCSLQPNSGAQGEYTGLLTIRAYHIDKKNTEKNICLIPESAHGTNPASAVMAGMNVVPIKCDSMGNIDIEDLKDKIHSHKDQISCMMVTYPSTHGVFEESINEICDLIHNAGGLVYLDGANMNAIVGLSKVGDLGVDVCHINLHKTFAIPHGGGGPGMGPICVKEHLIPFLPGHPITGHTEKSITAVSAAPFGSASILPISWSYIALLGNKGLKESTEIAILNANYMAKRIEKHFPVLYRGISGNSAHEFIIDLRNLKTETGISDEDVAKRLIDYGFHAPTMSWPVPGTLMIEPTESESKEEMDRFCDAMIAIRKEIDEVVEGKININDNPLSNAPHTAIEVMSDNWEHSYSREKAAYPADWLKDYKYWPTVSRVDNAHGDRNLICSCPPIETYSKQ